MPAKRRGHRGHNVKKATVCRVVGQRTGTELMQNHLFHLGSGRARTLGNAVVQATHPHPGTGVGKDRSHPFSLRRKGRHLVAAIILGQFDAECDGRQGRPSAINQQSEYNKIKERGNL